MKRKKQDVLWAGPIPALDRQNKLHSLNAARIILRHDEMPGTNEIAVDILACLFPPKGELLGLVWVFRRAEL